MGWQSSVSGRFSSHNACKAVSLAATSRIKTKQSMRDQGITPWLVERLSLGSWERGGEHEESIAHASWELGSGRRGEKGSGWAKWDHSARALDHRSEGDIDWCR